MRVIYVTIAYLIISLFKENTSICEMNVVIVDMQVHSSLKTEWAALASPKIC